MHNRPLQTGNHKSSCLLNNGIDVQTRKVPIGLEFTAFFLNPSTLLLDPRSIIVITQLYLSYRAENLNAIHWSLRCLQDNNKVTKKTPFFQLGLNLGHFGSVGNGSTTDPPS